jgi:hypothetical protein
VCPVLPQGLLHFSESGDRDSGGFAGSADSHLVHVSFQNGSPSSHSPNPIRHARLESCHYIQWILFPTQVTSLETTMETTTILAPPRHPFIKLSAILGIT